MMRGIFKKKKKVFEKKLFGNIFTSGTNYHFKKKYGKARLKIAQWMYSAPLLQHRRNKKVSLQAQTKQPAHTLLLWASILHPMDQGQLAQIRAALALGQAGTGQEANKLRDPGNHNWLPTSSSTE